MKKIVLLIIASFALAISEPVMAQVGPPDPPPEHGLNGNQEDGGGAPVGGGTLILIGLAGIYGAYRLYQKKKKSLLD